jgi:hypothetical protein
MDRGPFGRTRVRTAVIAGCIGLCLAGAAWLHSGPSRVLGVAPGTRLLTASRGTLYWLGRTCSIWRAELDDGRVASEPLEPLLPVGSCPADDARVDGDVIYQLTGLGQVVRHSAQRRAPMVQRRLLYALALDGKYVYAGNCAQANNCQIERMPAEDEPGDPILMQAGIHALANMDVDQNEIFWVDRGLRKPICANETNPDTNLVEYHCHDPAPPRLMAAKKGEARAVERMVLTDFDGRRPLLGAHHVYWLGEGGVHRVPKAGGENKLVLPTRTLSGFAADGDDVYLGADGGVFHARDGGALDPLQRTDSPPRGVAVDADFVYWIDGDRNAVYRRRR